MARTGPTPLNPDADLRDRATAEDLAEQVSALKADVARLTELLGQYGRTRAGDAAEEAERRAAALRAEVERQASRLGDQARRASDDAHDFVRERPGMAVALAAGLGFLVGFLTSRR